MCRNEAMFFKRSRDVSVFPVTFPAPPPVAVRTPDFSDLLSNEQSPKVLLQEKI